MRNSQYFDLDELLVMRDCVKWQRQNAEYESPSQNLEEFIIFHKYLETKITGYIENFQKSGNFSDYT